MNRIMKIGTYMVLSAVISAVVTSCNPNNGTPTPDPTEIKVVGKLGQSLTKVSADRTDLTLTWSNGDHIGVFYYPEGYDDAKLVNEDFRLNTISADKVEGSFTSTTAPKWHDKALSHAFYAVYPYDATTTDLTAVKVNIPTEYTIHDGDLFPETFVVGAFEDDKIGEEGAVEMQFWTPLAFVKVVLDASGSLIDGEDLTEAGISTEEFISGEATYNVMTNTFSDFDAKEIVFDYANGVLINGKREFYFAVNPNADLTSTNAEFKLNLEGAAFTASFDLELTNSLQAGEMSVIELNVADAVAAGKGSIDVEGTISTDLANTYIIATNSKMIIPVKQAYNAWSGYLVSVGKQIGATAKLTTKLMWTDVAGGFSSTSNIAGISMFQAVNGENAGIYVKTGSAEGNALIALEADGIVVWSWHIWVTNYDPNDVAGQTDILIKDADKVVTATHTLMDRNIGALNNTPGDVNSLGVAYQWGRKDPFPSSTGEVQPNSILSVGYRPIYDGAGNELTSGEGTSTGIYINWQIYLDHIEGIAYAVNNPTMYIEGVSVSSGRGQIWTSDNSAGSIQSPAQMKIDMWSNSSKTIFDPCPTGWRVPGDPNIAVELKNRETEQGFDNNTHLLKKGMDYGSYGYFPFSGMIMSSGGDCGLYREPGYWGGLWLNSTGGFGARAIAYSSYSQTYGPTESYWASYGLNVRCEKEW